MSILVLNLDDRPKLRLDAPAAHNSKPLSDWAAEQLDRLAANAGEIRAATYSAEWMAAFGSIDDFSFGAPECTLASAIEPLDAGGVTNIFVACLRGRGNHVREKFLQPPPGEILVPFQVLAELKLGAAKSTRPGTSRASSGQHPPAICHHVSGLRGSGVLRGHPQQFTRRILLDHKSSGRT